MYLNDDEAKMIKRYRELNQAKKKAVLASKQSFGNWLKTSLHSIWKKVSSFFDDIWHWFKGFA